MDLHKENAAQLFGVATCQVTPEQRKVGKMLNYSLAYSKPVKLPVPRRCMCGATQLAGGVLPCGH